MRTLRTWSMEQEALLRELFPQGKHEWLRQQINARTGGSFSKNAIIGKCRKLGLVKNPNKTIEGRKRAAEQRRKTGDIFGSIRKSITGSAHIPRGPVPKAAKLLVKHFDRYASDSHLGVSFFDLEPQHCRFPKGDGIAATYCGQPVQGESSYCAHHHALCYTKPDPRPRKVFIPGRRAA